MQVIMCANSSFRTEVGAAETTMRVLTVSVSRLCCCLPTLDQASKHIQVRHPAQGAFLVRLFRVVSVGSPLPSLCVLDLCSNRLAHCERRT